MKKEGYSYGAYNKSDDKEQWIRITEGCPHNCPYCYEPTEFKVFGVPEIIRNKVKIMDMNLLAKPESLKMIQELGEKKVNGRKVYYELICGIDYRFMTQEIADALKANRFPKIRIAWDWGFKDQYKIKDAITMLKKAGYKANNIMIFMVCNWKTPYEDNLMKLDVLKIWGCQVSDCWFDNQTFPDVKPIHWTYEQCKDFRRRCRKHNQLVTFKSDPEYKGKHWNFLRIDRSQTVLK